MISEKEKPITNDSIIGLMDMIFKKGYAFSG
jgi:hypothetical protein